MTKKHRLKVIFSWFYNHDKWMNINVSLPVRMYGKLKGENKRTFLYIIEKRSDLESALKEYIDVFGEDIKFSFEPISFATLATERRAAWLNLICTMYMYNYKVAPKIAVQ